MGLTKNAIGKHAVDSVFEIRKKSPEDRVIALAGNPNVGKSSVFNALTGMNQHTGNWPGKTVMSAQGYCRTKNGTYVMVDLPGTYSLLAHSAEEETARNFICFGGADAVVAVCDATCLERNMNLVLQILEITDQVVVCVNLMDEAARKGIRIDLDLLSERLGVPVIGTSAHKKKSLTAIWDAVSKLGEREGVFKNRPVVSYPPRITEAVDKISPLVAKRLGYGLDPAWISLRLLDPDESLLEELNTYAGGNDWLDETLQKVLEQECASLAEEGLDSSGLKDITVTAIVAEAERLCNGVVRFEKTEYSSFDRKLDRLLTGRLVGYPAMLFGLMLIFWLTVIGANYPSQLLSQGFLCLQKPISVWLMEIGTPLWLHDLLILGIYRVTAWVVSVMLPPMAIFFPLFTLLEDAGYLPRVAYNLDKPFKNCHACGKQALTMCMGFGCNAAGVVGCRIIDSPRERLLAILTNNFVPCNGRFPALIAILTMFFIGTAGGFFSSLLSALLLTGVIFFGIAMTMLMTKFLSETWLQGIPSSFLLEMPPYRKPQIGRVIVRSVFDRILFLLGRAVSVAAPAGLLLWLAANIKIGDASILAQCAGFLDPFARLMGLDGVILIAFILGFPANEIVLPIMIMAYTAQGSLMENMGLMQMRALLVENGWTWVTAVNVMLFFLLHWPCSTTMLTIRKETGSMRWTALAFLLPTAVGILACMIVTAVTGFFL